MAEMSPPAVAVVGGRLYTELLDVTSDVAALDSSGHWVVVVPYCRPEVAPGLVCARFGRVRPAVPWPGPAWVGPPASTWTSSLDRSTWDTAVRSIRSAIGAGEVYQVNLTRLLSAPLPPGADVAALGARLAEGNPAPFSAVVRLPGHGVHIASASPELYLRRQGRRVWSSPIKGTAATAGELTPKDRAENVMIVDLVRNDLGRSCEWGSVTVPSLLDVEPHPGLVHLVSTVEGRLRDGVGWGGLLSDTFPPGSVTGAPKIAACRTISELEPVERSYYCGAVGWVDADRREGELNVAIRTFWFDGPWLRFGTGGAITWDSDPAGEWAETELKASRLIGLASS